MAGFAGRSGNGIHFPDPNQHASSISQLAYVPLTESDIEPAARLYSEVFLHDEPTSWRIAPDPAKFFPEAEWYVKSLAGRNLSFIARNERTRDLVGFIFCFDITDDFGHEASSFTAFLANFREAVAMIDELENRYLDRSGISPGSVLHAFQGGVSRKYRRSGVMKGLVTRVVSRARERGFRQIVAECTSLASQRVLAQCGFYEQGFSSYDMFVIDGGRFFAGLDGGITLMMRDIE